MSCIQGYICNYTVCKNIHKYPYVTPLNVFLLLGVFWLFYCLWKHWMEKKPSNKLVITYEPYENIRMPLIQGHSFFLWEGQNDHHNIVVNRKTWGELYILNLPYILVYLLFLYMTYLNYHLITNYSRHCTWYYYLHQEQ